jgi:imidazole glycerol-phosphate synthase subunit HisH
LGICLGMQLMTNSSEEGNVTGLGWIDAETIRFEITNKVQFKVPHVGWNNLNVKNSNNILHNVSPTDYYYFVHSYYVSCKNESNIMALTDYEYSFASSIQKENIMGVQFHPEKSYEAGEKIFTNFMKL